MLVLAIMGTFFAWCSFSVFRSGNSADRRGPSLLAEAISLECKSEALLSEHRDVLDAHDASAPYDSSKVGFGRSALAARIALGEARAVQRLLDSGIDEDVVRSRLNRGKNAYAFAMSVVEEVSQERTEHMPEEAWGRLIQ